MADGIKISELPIIPVSSVGPTPYDILNGLEFLADENWINPDTGSVTSSMTGTVNGYQFAMQGIWDYLTYVPEEEEANSILGEYIENQLYYLVDEVVPPIVSNAVNEYMGNLPILSNSYSEWGPTFQYKTLSDSGFGVLSYDNQKAWTNEILARSLDGKVTDDPSHLDGSCVFIYTHNLLSQVFGITLDALVDYIKSH